LAVSLEEVAGKLWAGLVAQWEMDAELEALHASVAWVQDLVLDWANGPSCLAASLSMVAALLESRMDAAAANGVKAT
jgi:hypothetical protein